MVTSRIAFKRRRLWKKSIRFKYKKKSFKLKNIDAEMFSTRASFMSFIFVWDFPHIARGSDIFLFLYLFICPLIEVLVTWFLVWLCAREKTGFKYTVCRSCFVGGHCFFQLLWFYRVLIEDFALCF